MNVNEFYELLSEYTLDSKNYKKWRKIHGEAFGNTFLLAFEENTEAQIHLTAALINISQRNFELAMPKLNLLKSFCYNEFDTAVINYFIGLNHELLGDEEQMAYYYDITLNSDVNLLFNISFHPYYRTAKFAQRDAECSKALYYYKKALEFYEDIELDDEKSKIVSFIHYDIATVYLYAHKYDKSKEHLNISCKCNSSLNGQRDYVSAILYAVCGQEDELNSLFVNMSPFLRVNCQSMTSAILDGADPHYCVVPQNNKGNLDFWKQFLSDENNLTQLITQGDFEQAENIISENLTNSFPFMKKKLACRIEKNNEKIIVKCKNYCVKTLATEYESLFLNKNAIKDWIFISVNEFENY